MRLLKLDFLETFILQLVDGTPPCNLPDDINALGMENGDIVDENIIASSNLSEVYSPVRARFGGNCAWRASSSDSHPWIQADIGYQTYVLGVKTQGGGICDEVYSAEWVTSIKISTFYMTTSDEEVFVKDTITSGEIKVNNFDILFLSSGV